MNCGKTNWSLKCYLHLQQQILLRLLQIQPETVVVAAAVVLLHLQHQLLLQHQRHSVAVVVVAKETKKFRY